MTFCLGIKVREGLVGLADTRVTIGTEVITARKVYTHQRGRQSLFLMTSGLRSVRDKALTYFEETLTDPNQSFDRIFKAVNSFAAHVRRVATEDKEALAESGLHFNIYGLIGGQFEGDNEHKMYLVYPEGNWVEIGQGTPYQIIGAGGYGKPVLDRTLTFEDTMRFAFKVGCLAFDSTRISAADVDFPMDVVLYPRDSFQLVEHRYKREDLLEISNWWQERLRKSVNELPSEWIEDAFSKLMPHADKITILQQPRRDSLSMLFEVTHVTTYKYSRPVFLEPHTLRFHPRSDGQQRVGRFELRVDPQPEVMTECLDCEGNIVTEVWFGSLTDAFEVTAKFAVETLRRDPFDYLLISDAEKIPIQYPSEDSLCLAPYLDGVGVDGSVAEFAQSVAQTAKRQTVPFLFLLTQEIHDICRTVIREEGDPLPAAVTLAARQGSCRDLTVLFMDVCRTQGIASRFVSGYQEGVSGLSERDLHAWVEVYLPGGGWRSYDPTLGLAVSDRHIAVAASRTSYGAAPVTGSFRGTDATTQMASRIELAVAASPA